MIISVGDSNILPLGSMGACHPTEIEDSETAKTVTTGGPETVANITQK